MTAPERPQTPQSPQAPQTPLFLHRLALKERRYVADVLRAETVGGLLLLGAAVLALVFANTGLSGFYDDLQSFTVGPSALHLDLDLATWAKDGLLTVFFFVVGVELKRELLDGELRDPKAAALPVISAVCGMAVPALIYVAVNAGRGDLSGWAVPTATDIAFALAILAVIGSRLPSALRAFLLTLAVVDDLCAILIIAVFYTGSVDITALALSVLGLAVFWFLHRSGVHGWWIYLPLALVIWALMHESGIHATIAGVAMGLLLRVTTRPGEKHSPGEHIEHLVRPVSAGLAVPVFAFLSAGIAVGGGALSDVFTQPETLGIVLGLFVGKTLGIAGGARLAARFTKAELNPDLSWADVVAVGSLAGIGFTVSLLIGDLAFAGDADLTERTKAAVLAGSLISAAFACVILKIRNNRYRAIAEEESRDEDRSGTPDIDEQEDPAYHRRMADVLETRAAEHRRRSETLRRSSNPDDGPA